MALAFLRLYQANHQALQSEHLQTVEFLVTAALALEALDCKKAVAAGIDKQVAGIAEVARSRLEVTPEVEAAVVADFVVIAKNALVVTATVEPGKQLVVRLLLVGWLEFVVGCSQDLMIDLALDFAN